MKRLIVLLTILIIPASSASAGPSAPKDLRDLYFGEALYHAFQGEWFDAIARLDTELSQHYAVDEPERDTLHYHINQAEFDVGDFELAYRMHQRAGRAITAVIEGNVDEPVRNEALFRLARIYFQKDRPEDAQQAVERISGVVPPGIQDDLNSLRAQILMANGRFGDAARILNGLQDSEGLEGFASYNFGIALIRDGEELDGRKVLDRTGQLNSNDKLTLAIKDKANLVLGSKLLKDQKFEAAKAVLDRVRLNGPFSNRALLASGWADVFQGRFERALVPWSVLATRAVTDASVQEVLLDLPYAYGKLDVHSKAAVLYGSALEKFAEEINRLGESIESIRDGHFLKALAREELKQDADWVVKLRKLPQTPETYYLLDLMASHDFQESLKNYLDLEELRKKLETWERDLDAFEDVIASRRAYYEPLIPDIDRNFRRLDSLMRLRLEQRERIEKRLKAMLIVPRPDFLATAKERIVSERMDALERKLKAGGKPVPPGAAARIKRLQGVLRFNLYTEYDRRFTEAYQHDRELNHEVERLKKQYEAFVRTRQAATQSYEGYDDVISQLRTRIQKARDTVGRLMERQGQLLETMAVDELTERRERLSEFQIKARFAMADSYDRATRAKIQERKDQ
jgi:hypothetical protein